MARSAALLPPTTDHHQRAVLPPAMGSVPGSRRSAVAGEPNFCLASELLRPPVRLRGPRCFSTYTLYGACLNVNRVFGALFETAQSRSVGRNCWSLSSAGSEPRLESFVGHVAGTSRASGCERDHAQARFGRKDVAIRRADPTAQRRHSAWARPGWLLRRHCAAPAAAVASHGKQRRSLLAEDAAWIANQHVRGRALPRRDLHLHRRGSGVALASASCRRAGDGAPTDRVSAS